MKWKTSIIPIFFFTLLCLCCKDLEVKKDVVKVSIKSVKTEDSEKLIKDLITQVRNFESENSIEVIEQDCIFDQSTQTDEFLKNIEELSNYLWSPESKTAEIVLSDHWSLAIKRGGCDHFEMSASFVYDRVLDIEKDRKIVFDNIIWITSLLEDFHGEDIKRLIEEDKVKITKRDNFNYHANFMDESLHELYYFDFSNKDRTVFKISYTYY